MECIFRTYIVPAMPLLAAMLVYVLGRSAYFRQKEFELISKRYLEEGVDAIAQNVERSLGIFRHNWWQSTVVLKHFRDLGKDIPRDLYERAFIPPDPSLFELWRDYRLADLVGDKVFNRGHQMLDAFVRESYAFFQHDLGTMVRVTIEGGKELKVVADPKQMFDSYLEKIDELNIRARRFYILLGELQAIAAILQSERFTFDTIQKLKTRSAVKESIANLSKVFPPDEGAQA